MKYLIFMVLFLTGCPVSINPRLELGQCYHEYGDVGGTPDIIHCVHAVGNDGFLQCQGSYIYSKFHWYSCGDAEKWNWLSNDLRIVKCPKACVEVGNE